MADESAANANPPSFNLIGQYIRDMSFENPGAPASIMPCTVPKIVSA